MKIGVIVGRFQIDNLHKGYEQFITHVWNTNDLVVFLVGNTVVKNTQKDPLDFPMRKEMLEGYCNSMKIKHEIFPLQDTKSDSVWVQKLDELLTLTHGYDKVTLYGSRDSFIKTYQDFKGKYEVELFEPQTKSCSSDRRKTIAARKTKSSIDFRAGVIHAAYNRYPISFSTVDVFIIQNQPNGDRRILLGRKPNEKEYRFIGGFVDPTDNNLKQAAQRELQEETGITFKDIDSVQYFDSFRVDDWRYRGREDAILTNLIIVKLKTTNSIYPKASDDIEELRWFELDNNFNLKFTLPLVEEHQNMYNALHRHGFKNFFN